MKDKRVSIHSLATAVPRYEIRQTEIAALAQKLFSGFFSQYPMMLEVFANVGIERRYAVRPMEWYLDPRDWQDRAEVFVEEGLKLFEEVAHAAIERAGLAPDEIDHVMTVCSTGIATPSIEARALPHLGLREDVHRLPIFGLGCAGGVSGLAIASRLAAAEPGKNVLLVVLELCSLALRVDRNSKEDAVTAALFGDGAAALVLRALDGGGLGQIRGAAEHTWPDTLDVMGWTFDPIGFGVVLSRSVPQFVERRLPPIAKRLLSSIGVPRSEVGRYVCHPGGGRVVDALEVALKLPHGALDHERAVLRDYGNMSAPTVLFTLERVLRERPAKTLALSALGPGFSASLVALEPHYA